jgi:hypothetical protein
VTTPGIILFKVFGSISKKKQLGRAASSAAQSTNAYHSLIKREGAIGGQLFGRVPDGVSREFFCLDERTWIWHEQWVDKSGRQCQKTIKYEVRNDGILKSQDGADYQYVAQPEVENLLQATRVYRKRVEQELYARPAF